MKENHGYGSHMQHKRSTHTHNTANYPHINHRLNNTSCHSICNFILMTIVEQLLFGVHAIPGN